MVIDVFPESARFAFEHLDSSDITRVVRFVYDVAKRVSQAVYVLALEISGPSVGDPLLEDAGSEHLVYLGREDAPSVEWFGVGADVVVWTPHGEEWACELVARQWHQRQICWGMLVDERRTREVARDVRALWPRGSANGDPGELIHTVASERRLALLSYDGSWFDGKAFPDCWAMVRPLLENIPGARLEIYDPESADDG
jgi:hypothetical protein